MKTLNNNYLVRMVDVKPKGEPSAILGPDGKLAKNHLKFDEHPYQVEVIVAPEYFTVNGVKFENDVKPGDVCLISIRTYIDIHDQTDLKNFKKYEERLVTWQGEQVHLIRHQDIIAVK